ncbi:MAG: PHP domain-containing protein [Betaproteobacteria bacterium]|nr:PHP domain-containing protein [Betaproteobacteria bacterium]
MCAVRRQSPDCYLVSLSTIDLHSHSTHSDGLLRPRELVGRAAVRGVKVLALTDHEGARCYVTNPELVGRAHFARFLVERGYARDVSSVFRKYLAPGKPGYVAHQWASLAQAVGWIAASGGIAVLAHPGRYPMNDAQRDGLFSGFKEAGGHGVEVVTGSHTSRQFHTYARYAQRYGLLVSAGSDFHGAEESRRDLGDLPPLPDGCTPVWAASAW